MELTENSLWSGSAELHYAICGAGEPLLMLHGNGEDRSCFDRQLEDFAPRFRLILPDSRGHGRSAHGNEPLTIALLAKDALALLDALEIEKANVLGFSDGGNVALQLALDAPERISRLVLSGANADPDGIRLRYLFPMWLRHIGLTLRSIVNERAAYDIELLELMTKQPRFYSFELDAVRLPVLVTAGEHDMIRREHTQYLHRRIAGSELVIFEGGTHFVHLEQPERYNAAVLKFLTEEREQYGKEAI